MRHTLIQRLLIDALAGLVKRGTLLVTTSSGQTTTLGDGTSPRAAIRFADRAAERALLLDPELQFGELFMNDRLLVEEGTVYTVLELVLRDAKLAEVGVSAQLLDKVRFSLRRVLQNNRPRQARANVHHHYDLGNALYDLFLDPDRQYSCAYFERPDHTLEQAQLAKKRHIAAKLLVRPGDRVLDIGCGWGGLCRYLARTTDAAQLTGITLSEEQISYAQSQVGDLASRLSFRLEDYRHTPGQFDRIVSVGMFEHVGIGFYEVFFNKIRELMSDDGVMLLHFIGKCAVPDFNHPFIEKYIFPGGHLASLSEVTTAIEHAGLLVTDLEILRLHYAQTLSIWRERFMARRDEAKAMYDERFCKMWEFYLSMAEAAFRFEDVAVFQFQLAKRQENVPLTRDYMETAKRTLLEREAAAGITA